MSEAKLSRDVCSFLRKNGCFYQRIESASTGVGIPDLVIVVKGGCIFVELKDTSTSFTGSDIHVDWRVGQVSWAYNYFVHSGRITFTLLRSGDGCYLIPMNKRYTNAVSKKDVCCYGSLFDTLKYLVKYGVEWCQLANNKY